MMVAMEMMTRRAILEAGEMLRGEALEEFRERLDAPVLETVGGEDLGADSGLVGRWVFGAEIEDGGLAGVVVDLIHGGERDVFAAAFAVLDDATDGEGVVEALDGVADLEAWLRRPGGRR